MTRLLVLLVAFAVATRAPAHAADAKAPNVLFLFADDQRSDTIAALGNTHIKSPHLDCLVKRGLTFDRAYMQGGFRGATCVPSRAMLLSGQSLFRVDEKLLRDVTCPEAFGRAGYATFISGKWHNGEKSLVRTFRKARGIFSGGMTNPLMANLADLAEGKLGTPKHAPKHAFADEEIGFLNRTHDPHLVPDDFPVIYDPDQLPMPANALPQHPFDNGEMTIRDEALLVWPCDPQKVREMLAENYRYVSYFDAEIGRVLDAHETSPYACNTIVVFSANSGVARGSHGLIGKQNLYEHSLRVPLVIVGAGVPRGQRTAAMCYLFDVLPILGEVFGVAAPAASEGGEFTATLSDPERAALKNLVFEYRNAQRAIRDDRWKLICYPYVDKTQLFDLNADPDEATDLAGKPELAAKVKELLTLLEAEKKRSGD